MLKPISQGNAKLRKKMEWPQANVSAVGPIVTKICMVIPYYMGQNAVLHFFYIIGHSNDYWGSQS